MLEKLKMEAAYLSEKLVHVTQDIMILVFVSIRISYLNMKHLLEREKHNNH